MFTTEEMPLEDMQKVVDRGYTCGQCGARLNIAWGGSFGINSQILRCGKDINHNTINRHDKQREAQIKIIREVQKMDSTALMKMDEAKMMQRVEMAKFPQDLTLPQKKLLAQVAITYGFDPLMGEVSIYQGNPYVSIDGRRRKAQETNELDGTATRPATPAEKEAAMVPQEDHYWHADIWRKGYARPFEGWGRVSKEEIDRAIANSKKNNRDPYFLPVVKDPRGIAEKRAEAKGLRKGFHIPLPSFEDIGSPEEDPVTDVRVINISTGEIKETSQPEPTEATRLIPIPVKTEGGSNHPPTPLTPEEKAKTQQVIDQAERDSKELWTEKIEPVIDLVIDLDWLEESLRALSWADVGKYLANKYGVKGRRIKEMVLALTPEQQKDFAQEVQRRLEVHTGE